MMKKILLLIALITYASLPACFSSEERATLSYGQLLSTLETVNEDDAMSALSRTTDVAAHDTPLHIAARRGFERVVKELLSRGAPPTPRNHENEIPLHCAARHGHFAVAKSLLADQDYSPFLCTNHEQQTPVDVARENNHSQIVSFLLFWRMHIDNYSLAIKYIKAHPEAVHARNEKLETPLHFAVRRRGVENIQFFIDNGADVNAKDADGKTPLMIAATDCYTVMINGYCRDVGNPEMINLLVKHGADLSIKDDKGNTLLHKAAVKGYTPPILCLLQHNPSFLDRENNDGDTALFLAAGEANKDAVFELLNAGAKTKNSKGKTIAEALTCNFTKVGLTSRNIELLLLTIDMYFYGTPGLQLVIECFKTLPALINDMYRAAQDCLESDGRMRTSVFREHFERVLPKMAESAVRQHNFDKHAVESLKHFLLFLESCITSWDWERNLKSLHNILRFKNKEIHPGETVGAVRASLGEYLSSPKLQNEILSFIPQACDNGNTSQGTQSERSSKRMKLDNRRDDDMDLD